MGVKEPQLCPKRQEGATMPRMSPPPPKKITNVYLPSEYIRAGERLMAERTTWTEAQRVTFAEPHRRPNEDWIRREMQAAYEQGRRDGWRDAMIGSLSAIVLSAIVLLAILRAI